MQAAYGFTDDLLFRLSASKIKAKLEKAKEGYDKMEQDLKSREAKELEENRKYIAAFEKISWYPTLIFLIQTEMLPISNW